MSRKVIVNVEFEFYPDEDDFYRTHYASTPDDKLAADFVETLNHELSTMNNDGLWWNISTPKVVKEANENNH